MPEPDLLQQYGVCSSLGAWYAARAGAAAATVCLKLEQLDPAQEEPYSLDVAGV